MATDQSLRMVMTVMVVMMVAPQDISSVWQVMNHRRQHSRSVHMEQDESQTHHVEVDMGRHTYLPDMGGPYKPSDNACIGPWCLSDQ